MKVRNKWYLLSVMLFFSCIQASVADDSEHSIHLGILHPSGMDLFGYSVERHMNDKLYWYYTIGVPSVLAIGIIHYNNRDGNGLTTTLGIGLGFSLYASITYQLKLGNQNFLKLGTSILVATYYPYAPIEETYYVITQPIIAYEYRF